MTTDVTLFFSSLLVYFHARWPKMKSTSLLFPTGSHTTQQWQRTEATFSYCESGNRNFHLKQLHSKLYFDPQIHLFSYFILAIAFVSPQTHKYNTGF